MNATKTIKLFLKPESVAVIGAPRRTGRGSFNIVENLQQLGFKGQIYPVNPNIDELLGLRVYHSASELPAGIDLGIVIVGRESVPQAVADGAESGIKAFIIITEGFAEADDIGKTLQAKLTAIAKERGIRILGPNSLGVVNGFHCFSSSFAKSLMTTNPVALICQSGGFLGGFSGFTPGKSIDVGNMCDVDFTEVMDYLGDDPETKVIALHIEGLRDGRRFLKVAQRVRQKKPILVLKAGKSQRAARSAASHTGSLAGKDEVYRAAFKQVGLIQVEDVDALGDIAQAFVHLPMPQGNRVAILTPSGAAATTSLDAIEQYGFQLAKLSEKTVNSIKEFYPGWSPPLNPVDMMSAGLRYGYNLVYSASLKALLDDENVDIILCVAGFPTLRTIKSTINGRNKPVVTWVIGNWGEGLLAVVKETGYESVYSTPQRAFQSLAALRLYSTK